MYLGESIDNRSSRVVLALGSDAISKMANCNIGVIGLSPTGSEIIKNLILTGIGKIEINDSRNLTNLDLGSNFFVRDSDMNLNGHQPKRIEVIPKRLNRLNRSCKITATSEPITDDWLLKFDSIILSEIRTFSEISQISSFCHDHKIQFIFAATVGPNAVLFEDFGEKFTCNSPNGEQPLEAHVNRIRKVKNGQSVLQINKSEVDVIFPVNTTVRFENVNEMPEINGKTAKILKLIYPNNDKHLKFGGQYLIDLDTTKYKSFSSSSSSSSSTQGKVVQVINPCVFNHKKFNDALDFQNPIKDLIIAISKFWEENNRPPKLLNKEDAENIFNRITNKENHSHLKESSMLFSTEYPPISGMIGGCASMECIKYCTGVTLPTTDQWVTIDRSCIIDWKFENPPKLNGSSRYDPIVATIGNETQSKLREIKALIVGVGAIGCEFARYAALFGFNRITLIDNDSVELSNLTRQFLFRDKHQGVPKATVGRQAILKANSDLKPENVISIQEKFSEENVLKVGRDFDIVFSAVDSPSARNFISDYAASCRIPMINAGMMKYRANFSIIIPYKTLKPFYNENQTKSELACTLKVVLTTPHHLLQWAHNEFLAYFVKEPSSAQKCVLKKGKINEPRDLRDGVNFLLNKPKNFKDCVQWSLNKFTAAIEYDPLNQVQQGKKLKPCPFDIKNKWHRQFLLSASILKAKVHGIEVDKTNELLKIEETLKECRKESIDELMDIESQIIDTSELLKKLNSLDFEKEIINPLNFDKDDPDDLDFIEGFAKSRADVFSILMDSITKLDVMKIVGSIAPTLATTTAVVGAAPFSGLSMLFNEKINYEYEETTSTFNSKMLDGQIDLRQVSLLFMSQFSARRSKRVGLTDNKFCVWDFIDVVDNPTLEEISEKMMKMLRSDVTFDFTVGDKFIVIDENNKKNRIVDEFRKILGYDDDFYLVDVICSSNDENEVIELPRLKLFTK